jgi:hypothetical protein
MAREIDETEIFRTVKDRNGFEGFHLPKQVEEPRLRAVTHFGMQARALAHGAPL